MKKRRLRVVGIAVVAFMFVGWSLTSIAPSIEIAWVLSLLLLTVFLFSFEIIAIDVAALTILVMLGLSTLLAPVMGLDEGLVDINGLFAVAPIGIALIVSGILYFVLLGPVLLPKSKDVRDEGGKTEKHFHDDYGIDYTMAEVYVPSIQ